MNTRTIRAVVTLAGLAGLGLVGTAPGCELLVALDRSAVDSGNEGCTICSDAATGQSDAGLDAPSMD